MGTLILDSMLQKLPNDVTCLPSTFATEFFVTHDAKVNEPIWQQTKTQGKSTPLCLSDLLSYLSSLSSQTTPGQQQSPYQVSLSQKDASCDGMGIICRSQVPK